MRILLGLLKNMVENSEVKTRALLLKFVRCCLNRAYAMTDDSHLSAEEKHALEAILSRIRDEEDSWRKISDLANFLKTEFISIYEDALRRLPPDLVRELFLKTVDLCMEIDEIVSVPELKRALESARKAILLKYEKVVQEQEKR